MEELIAFLPMIVFYILITVAGGKKKARKAQQKSQKQRGFEQAFSAGNQENKTGKKQKTLQTTLSEAKERMEAARKLLEQAEQGKTVLLTDALKDKIVSVLGQDDAPAQKRKPVSAHGHETEGAALNEACDMNAMHLHMPDQAQMEAAGEGEDPCHVGEAPEHSWTDEEENGVVAERQAAQALLQGVIMSEILTRPAQRRAGYGRRA